MAHAHEANVYANGTINLTGQSMVDGDAVATGQITVGLEASVEWKSESGSEKVLSAIVSARLTPNASGFAKVWFSEHHE